MTPEERTLLLVTAQRLRNHMARIGDDPDDVTALDAAALALIHEDAKVMAGTGISHAQVVAGAEVLRNSCSDLYFEASETRFQDVVIKVFRAMKES